MSARDSLRFALELVQGMTPDLWEQPQVEELYDAIVDLVEAASGEGAAGRAIVLALRRAADDTEADSMLFRIAGQYLSLIVGSAPDTEPIRQAASALAGVLFRLDAERFAALGMV